MKNKSLTVFRDFIRETLTEAISPSESFVTKVKGSKISLYGKEFNKNFQGLSLSDEEELGDVVAVSSGVVNWGIEFELREWGVKDINISIQNIVINIDISSKGETGFKNIVINSLEENFKIINNLEIHKNSILWPTELEVNFESKEIIVR